MTEIVRPAQPSDRQTVLSLLASADLPTGDLHDRTLEGFLVAMEPGGGVVAAIGLEVHGEHGLLRSLVVAPAARNRGLGRRLVAAVEARACERGVRTLWLLTTTAAAFFSGLGYEHSARADTPPAIAATTEFRGICPASAALLRRDLGDRAV